MSAAHTPSSPGVSIERRESGRLYGRTATDLSGALQPAGPVVEFRDVLTRGQRRRVLCVGAAHVVVSLALAVYLLLPSSLPQLGGNAVTDSLAVGGLVLMVLLQLIAGLRTWTIAFHVGLARDPIPMRPRTGLRVAVLTTIVPGKEPVELVMTTLRAMKRIRHDGPLDVWLLDEGDDPEVRRRCEEMGVKHFSRKGHPEWNQPRGPYRARTKHGNHNSWRAVNEHRYDVVAQMDPDHVPFPNFLERTLGYFSDEDVAFVVAPQVYGNLEESFVARGAAELAYLFHGVIQRGGNGHEAPLLIGTNHLYRPAAFAQIGGYQDCIIEDHLTSMALYTGVNAATGGNWKGVYTPDIIAVGEGPATYSDFFSQQKRWAYGIWQIARQHSPTMFGQMRSPAQRLSFFALQTHYPTTSIAWVGGIALTALYLVGGVSISDLPLLQWGVLFSANMVLGLAFTFAMRRYNLVEHERRSWGLAGMALDLLTAPVYVAAAVAQLAGRPLVYVVTAKGSAATGDTWRTFRPHLLWAAVALFSIAAGLLQDHDYATLYVWATVTLVCCLAPLVHVGVMWLTATVPAMLPRVRPVIGARRIGQILVAQGVLTVGQLQQLLDLQATSDGAWTPLGSLAVEQGMATREQVAVALRLGTGSQERVRELAGASAALL
ncbi:glycosyltransferase family 2 protein [Trujillonella endophytica]|uniref:Glycosyltransferase, catalytic subunit of cellulose synthase and poly-beta-1,6-N-acetylglucosamine synthase n=1 Tax=Trujillonella endophytica TaxID=673521 RepID=A0A1H8TPD0_9ACTN|nr:glycosyltransferase family 2 protein [Trujillella endophytica]SEO92393.1 Glycosyltransferase, catalytic subunit of cellulose synthase and poly-beta-1,6-N-acetylglucosamine synthase [Trujillella endophytica]